MKLLKPWNVCLFVCAMLWIGTGVTLWINIHPQRVVQSASIPPRTSENIDRENIVIALDDLVKMGSPGSKVILMEFGDFECPFCGTYAREIHPRIQRDFIDAGRVEFVFRHFPLPIHKSALNAARAATCARSQDRYWPYHEMLFLHQKALSGEDLVTYAEDLRMDEAAFRKCLVQPVPQDVERDIRNAKQLGVEGTPTFLIGLRGPNHDARMVRRIRGTVSYETLKETLDEIG